MGTATAQQVLNLARTQLGTTERPPGTNRTPYGRWYGWDGVAWCQIYMCWVFDQAGALSLLGRKTAGTVNASDWFRSVNQWGTEPRVGSLAFFDFPDSKDRIQHVGIVEEIWPDARIVTIEGNTSSGEKGSQDNGDGVYRRVRSLVHVVGFGHPAYSRPGRPTKPTQPPARKLLLLVDGVWGKRTTIALQRHLGIPADGVIGPQTRRAVQRWAGLTGRQVDGVWGRRTRRGVQRKLGVPPDGQWGTTTIKALQRYLNRL